MPWIYFVIGHGPDGPVYKRRWVAEPKAKSKKPPTGGNGAAARAAARRKAAALARKRAAAAAQRAAAARARANADKIRVQNQRKAKAAANRRASYEALMARQRALARAAGLVKDSPGSNNASKQPANTTKPKRPQGSTSGGMTSSDDASKQTAKASAYAASQWSAKYRAWFLQQALSKAKAGDSNSARALEKALEQQKDQANETGTASTAAIEKLRDQYEQHAVKVNEQYALMVAIINKLLDKNKVQKARDLYYSKDFVNLQKEYKHLFGDGRDPLHDGSYGTVQSNLQSIADSQRRWWANQMKASLQSKLDAIRHAPDSEDEQKLLSEQLRYINGDTPYIMDGYKVVNGHPEPQYRRMTYQEAVERQYAQLDMARQKAVVQRMKQDAATKRMMMMDGYVPYKGTYVQRDQVPLLNDIEKYMQANPNAKMDFKDSTQLQGFADDLVKQWAKDHPPPSSPKSAAYQRWQEMRASYEKQVYGFFGASVPQWYERLLQAPGVSHALSILQAGTSAIGGAGRVAIGSANYALSGGTNNESAFYLGPQPDNAPPEIQKQMRAARTAPERRRIYLDFLRSTEGQIWAADQKKIWQEEQQKQLEGFYQGFYGGSNTPGAGLADPGKALQSLNDYGSNPTSDMGMNLIFQLLVDPTNAIPLKATTWFARGAYASDVTKGAGKIASLWQKPHAFLTVDEATLRMRKTFSSFEKEIAARGLSEEQAMDMLNERLVGVKTPEETASRINDFLRWIGVDPRKVNESMVGNLAEMAAIAKFKKEGGELLTQSAVSIDKRIKAADEARVKNAQLDDAARKATQKVDAERAAKLEAGTAARQAEAAARESQEAELLARAEKKVAASERAAKLDSEKASAAAPKELPNPQPHNSPKPKTTKIHETTAAAEVKQVEAKVTERPTWDAADEFYYEDHFGNKYPKAYFGEGRKELQSLRSAASKGDVTAMQNLRKRARFDRNAWRTEQEDMPLHTPRNILRYRRPTLFDLADRAGVAGDAKATENLLRDRNLITYLKKSAGRGNDDFVRSHRLSHLDDRDATHIVQRSDAEKASDDVWEYGDASFINIGEDIIHAREATARGLHDLYEPFSHDSLRWYDKPFLRNLKNPSFVKNMTTAQFARRLRLMRDFEVGAASFRDGGQWLFEVFHQLRLAKDWEKLREFSDLMTRTLVSDDDYDIFAWMWKVMEDRVGLPYALPEEVIQRGFYDAAEAWNLHPQLAMSSIPNGYYGRRAPMRFGLSARLAGAADAIPEAFPAPMRGYNLKTAKNEITRVFLGKGGEPGRVLTYVANRFGEFYKNSEVSLRLKDELVYAAARALGPQQLTAALLRVRSDLGQPILNTSRNTEQLANRIFDQLEKSLGQYGANLGGRRPEFADLREAVVRLYDGGALPGLNANAHKMMFFARLQGDPRNYRRYILSYLDYMADIGGDAYAEAKALVSHMYEGQITTEALAALPARGRAAPLARGRITLWEKHGLIPSKARLDAARKLAQKKADELDYEFERELKRQDWAEEDFHDVQDAYAGSIDTSKFTANVDSLIADIRKGDESALGSLEATIRSHIERMMHSGGAEMDQHNLDDLRDALEHVAEEPEAARIIRQLQEEFGAARLDSTMDVVTEPLAWREVEVVRLLNMVTDESGKVIKGREQVARRYNLEIESLRKAQAAAGRGSKSRRINLDHLREAYGSDAESLADAAKAGAADAGESVQVRPQTPEQLSHQAAVSQMYSHIFRMSESEWLTFEKERAYRVLNGRASDARKAEARARLERIAAAEYAIKIEKSRGTYVPWEQRAAFAKKVTSTYADEARHYIAPKHVAPFIQRAADAPIETFRSLWRLKKSAAPTTVPSPVKGISKNGEQFDHMPKEVWDEIHDRVSTEIHTARGWVADTLTAAKHKGKSTESQKPLGKLSDDDPLVLAAKQRALLAYAKETGWHISMNAYDEARRVLRRSTVQEKTALRLLREAMATGDDLEEAFLRLRQEAAETESLRQLNGLAYGEMFGAAPEDVFGEFIRRYGDDTDNVLKNFTPELSPFQMRTIDEHLKTIGGIDNLDDPTMVANVLQSANMPPLNSRNATREFLKRIGAWSPRTKDAFESGAKSWDIEAEADYWRTAYGVVPEWTDPAKLANEFNEIFDDYGAYQDFMRKQGVFNRSQELTMRLEGLDAEAIEREIFQTQRREIDLQRQYVIQRYGKLVSRDGVTLDRMPWLMNPEELKRYMAARTGKKMPEGFVQNPNELDELTSLIEIAMEPYFEKYVRSKWLAGEQVTYHDMFKVASEVQAQLLANPKWARRYRDVIGNTLNRWAWFNRWLVFSNPAFLTTNVIDVPVKSAWFRYSRRSLFNPELARQPEMMAAVDRLTPRTMGMDATTAMYREKQMKSWERLRDPRGYNDVERALDRVLALIDGTGEVFPTIAGHTELIGRMTLAKNIFPTAYAEALKRFPDPEVAFAAAKNFVKDEVNTLWPTAGHGPIEKLWNKLVPFASYNIKNKVMFISEALAHPAVLNYIDRIGDYIEYENVSNWEKEHPGMEMPLHLRRRIELPWAPGYYFDLSSLSDASRGLKPIFDLAQKKQSMMDWMANWVRVVNPGAQAGIYMLFNAYGLFPKTGWVPILDDNGFPTGSYQLVNVPWTEPWSQDQPDLSSVFWFSQLMETYGNLDWTPGELSHMVGQAFFFNAVSTYDRGSVLQSFYMSLKNKDPEAAKQFLLSADGEFLQDWWEAKAKNPVEVRNSIRDLENSLPNPADWFYDQTPATREKIQNARDIIKGIRDAYAEKLFLLDPTTQEYRDTKAKMYFAINEVYLATPELMESEVWGKTPAEWSRALADWQVDKQMDTFMALSKQRPKRAKYETSEEYEAALDAWDSEKQKFLQTYPQVAQQLNAGREEVNSVRDAIEKTWDEILDRTAARQEKIDAANKILEHAKPGSKAAEDAHDRLDILYLQNELDYSLLERDYAASYFSKEDFDRLPPNVAGPPTLKGNFIKRTEAFFDFDRRRYEKAVKEGKGLEWLRDNAYNQALHDAILKAKGGDPFGEFDPAKFVRAVKADKDFAKEYFKRNEGKQAQWAKNDEYIRRISVWGKLAAAGRWSEANRAWDNLPQWVKDRYYAKHPDRRRKAQQTSQYLGYMQHWVGLFKKGDKKGAMAYFNSLPDWAKERYYKKHPDRRAEWSLNDKISQKLRDYFAGRDEDRAAFLKANPDLAQWLSKNGSSKQSEVFAILAAYKQIPKEDAWLRRVYREKYPEVFSAEAKGKAKLRRVYDNLAKHPSVLPAFEEWVNTIWDTYEEMLKHAPRPASANTHLEREVPERAQRVSLSAAELRALQK